MGEPEGLELDLAVPTIARGAAIGESGATAIISLADRARAFHQALGDAAVTDGPYPPAE
jgi:hypothetical protein